MVQAVWGQQPGVRWGESGKVWGVGAPAQEDIVSDILFTAPSLEETTIQLASHLPRGKAWAYKLTEGRNTYSLIRSAAIAFNRVQEQIEQLASEFNVPLTNELLPDWEDSVGIPDDCQDRSGELTERRNSVIRRLSKQPIVTRDQFQALGFELSGVQTTVRPGQEVDMPPNKHSRFKLYVSFGAVSGLGFPYNFPAPFGGFRSDIVECVFKSIVPASVLVILE